MCYDVYNICLNLKFNHIQCDLINDDMRRGGDNRTCDCFIITHTTNTDVDYCYIKKGAKIGYFNDSCIVDNSNKIMKTYAHNISLKNKIYYCEQHINKIKKLLFDFFNTTTDKLCITNYKKNNDSKYDDLTERILLCYILNFHKDLFIKSNQFSNDFITYLNECWIESNEQQYGPDIIFKHKINHDLMLYGDVECYQNRIKQKVYDRKLKINKQNYYTNNSVNENLSNVYVFRFLYDLNTGNINNMICYNITDLAELSPGVLHNNEDSYSILDETHYININLTDLNIKRCAVVVDVENSIGIEYIYINNKILKTSNNIEFKVIKKDK